MGSVGAMTTSPTSQAGVVGAILQTAIQAGNAIALTIQAGLFTIHPGGIADYRNVQASFWFIFAWGGAFLLVYWLAYRTPERKEGPSRAVMAH
jgi:gentisate 1,2-dioxygenase